MASINKRAVTNQKAAEDEACSFIQRLPATIGFYIIVVTLLCL